MVYLWFIMCIVGIAYRKFLFEVFTLLIKLIG